MVQVKRNDRSGMPLKKIAKIITAHKAPAKNVKEIVREAFKNDPSKRDELFDDCLNKGFDKEIAEAYLDRILAEKNNIQIHSEDVIRLRGYFLLLGPDSSVQLLERYVKAVEELIVAGYTRNITLLLSYFLSTTNILNFEKLRVAVKNSIPILMNKLWAVGMTGESTYLARHFCYVLVAEEMYLGVSAKEVWNNLFITSMKTSPVLALLTYLISGEPDDVDRIISTTSLDELQRSRSDPILDEREQVRFLVVSHFSTFVSRMSFPTLVNVLRTVTLSYCDRDKVGQMIQDLTSSRDISDMNIAWRAIMATSLNIIQEELETKASVDIAAALGGISGLFTNKDVPGDRVFSILQKLFIHNERSNGTFFVKHECGYLTRAVVSVVNFIPVSELSVDVLGLTQVAAFIVGTAFSHHTASVLSACVRGLSSTLGDSGCIKFFSQNWCAALFEYWLPVFVKLREPQTLRIDMYNVLRGFIRSDTRSHEEQSGGLLYLLPSAEDSDPCSESRLARLFAYTDPIYLMKLQKELKVNEFDELLFELTTNSLHRAISAADFKNAQVYDAALVERWSVLFLLFKSITRSQRKILLPKLLTGKTGKNIAKLAYRILSERFKVPEQSHTVIIERTTEFFLNIVPGLDLGDDGQPSRLIQWNSLLNINSCCPNLLPSLWENGTKDHVSSLYDSFMEEVEECDRIKACSVLASIPVEKLSVDSAFSEHVANILDCCSEDVGILQFCQYLIKIATKTSEEGIIVHLCLTVAATHHVTPTDITAMLNMSQFLFNLIRQSSSTVNNGQNALYASLFTKHLIAVHHFVEYKNGTVEEADRLVYGCGKIAHLITQQSMYYSRIVAPVISEVIFGYNEIELAITKLHSMVDKYSSALLATTLPPSQKLQYSRIFPDVRKAKKIV